MLLSLLNRKQKLKFLDLAIHMIVLDGAPTDVEKRLLDKIYGEIGKEVVDEYTFSKSDSIDQTIEYFKGEPQVVKNILFLNLVSISMQDDLYNTSEHLFLERLQKEYQITALKRKNLMAIVYAERDIRERAMREVKS